MSICKSKIVNINYLEKYKQDLDKIDKITLVPTYEVGDIESEYDVKYDGEVVASMIVNTDTGLIKMFSIVENKAEEMAKVISNSVPVQKQIPAQ